MTIGERIRRIRTFRNVTQYDLGVAVGFPEKNADVRISQYESGYRVPKQETLDKIAEVLHCNRLNFYTVSPGTAEDIMFTFFWLDEDNRSLFRLFRLERNKGKANHSDDRCVRYNDSDDWPAHPPVALWFDYPLVDRFMSEWCLRKQQLKDKMISENEYFEWKLNWPATSSDFDAEGNDKGKCSYPWRSKTP